MPRYRWVEPVRQSSESDLTALGLLGDILASRGVNTGNDARILLDHDFSSIPDPQTLPDVELAAERIRLAINSEQRIAVFGDYDVDGVTSTAFLVRSLSELGADVRAYLPHRERDGYGLNLRAVERAAGDGCTLLITVDCGTGNRTELEYASSLGLESIVIDHHHVLVGDLPCTAFVSPRRPDSLHCFSEYAAVGVAYQLMRHVVTGDSLDRYLPLIALGTVADVVPLTGPNRAIVHHGLRLFDTHSGPGLKALADVSGVNRNGMRSHHFGFLLGPRVNAAGRIDDPWIALELLLTDSDDRAIELASRLNDLNRERQRLLDEYVEQARKYVEDGPGMIDNHVLVVHAPEWKVGLVGLISSRLSDIYGRPVIALEQTPELSRGSARSIDEFNVVEALHACADLLDQFGGHSKAAGLTLRTNRIEAFTERINAVFRQEVGSTLPLPSLNLDAELTPDLVSLQLLDDLTVLEPCGHGNPPPTFLIRDARIHDPKWTRNQAHLQLKVPVDRRTMLDGIAFGAGSRLKEIRSMERADLAVSLRRDNWRGRTSVKLDVIDFRPVQQ